jgi:hypothetical protein
MPRAPAAAPRLSLVLAGAATLLTILIVVRTGELPVKASSPEASPPPPAMEETPPPIGPAAAEAPQSEPLRQLAGFTPASPPVAEGGIQPGLAADDANIPASDVPLSPLGPATELPAASVVDGPVTESPESVQAVPPGPAEQPKAPLDRPLESPPPPPEPTEAAPAGALYTTPVDPPLGFAGRSGILPTEVQDDNHFVPVEDRWRVGFPEWDRYGKGHPLVDDYPYVKGSLLDPFNQNVLKGDYPIIGQHTFLVVTASLDSLQEVHDNPVATTPFESNARPREADFFGRNSQYLTQNYLTLSFDLFHGDAAFRPVDWRVKVTPVFNFNYLSAEETAVVNPDVTHGTSRGRTWFALEEWFIETKLADTSPDYDFVSVRAGSQPFTSDFRGFIFSDVNRGVRLFGTRNANREQFNVAVFYQLEKNTDSELNTFADRRQTVAIANYYVQDFIFPGYTAEWSIHYNHDESSVHYDQNGFLVRPDPAGVAQPHELDVAYLGWAGDGHINRFNINHAAYWALGHDSVNPIAGTPQEISAGMAAVELSYDYDWMRFRTSFFWSSGDHNPDNHHATGFDSILDNPNFAGGEFSFWQRQAIHLLGVNLVNRESLVPDLRSSKTEGQSNFVNPGLVLGNVGVDLDLTPKLRMVNNVNFLWFDQVQPLREFVFQSTVHRFIGTDLSTGVEYRPLLSNNIIFKLGFSTLIPGRGFTDLFGNANDHTSPLVAAFLETVLLY